VLVDDRSSSVSLPEVPLLGVLPGTGGLTRVTDKRHVRHDHADIFCTSVEGVRGQKAVDWRLVDTIAKPAQFAEVVAKHVKQLPAHSKRAGAAAKGQGVQLKPLHKTATADSLHYGYVQVDIDRAKRTATLTVSAPKAAVPTTLDAIHQAGDSWYPLQMARELDDAILCLRSNELDIGTWLLKTTGDAALALQSDAVLVQHQAHWLVNETIGLLRRTLARLDVSSRSLFALIDEGTCFAGTLAELAFCADRAYMLALPDAPEKAPHITLSELNMGYFPMVNHQSRLQRRFYEETAPLEAVRAAIGKALDADQALALGLVTAAPDDIDWADELRIAIEERAAMSPDSLTGLEANLRFAQKESMETRIFGRLSAWQNWIFNRPNAVGDKGALKVYGKGEKAAFDMNRV
jgi:benzoyl-CoA-dihydrodiol lyase